MDCKRSFVLLAIMIALAVIATSMTISYNNRAFAQVLPDQASDQAREHSVLSGNCPPEHAEPTCR